MITISKSIIKIKFCSKFFIFELIKINFGIKQTIENSYDKNTY